ncbi:hypothetical protein AYI68_g557 [Smittium mucronatum]|uniref:Uncharacterized protein n=1 Tax=Smittium mucronatum TaxID=133383 RepID=A0A1R0H845_9FUNG|nr:hypothetical protein AYI68_g557 [Smittium mucronatum]
MREREPQLDEEGPFFAPIIPVTEITVYKELSEALPGPQDGPICVPKNQFDELNSATAELFSLNPGEEVGYHDAPDSDCACSSHTTDILLYPDISFANTMRVMLSDIAKTVTQSRIENLHRGMELPGRAKQIFETETKPHIDQDTFDALLASTSKLQPHAGGSTATATDHGFLFSTVHNYEEDWRPPLCAESEESQSECGGTEFQDGNPSFHLQNGQKQELNLVSRTTRRCYMCYFQSPFFWAVTQLPDVYKDSMTSFGIGPVQGKFTIYVDSPAPGEAYVSTTTRAEESISLQYEIMDFDGNNNEARASEPAILERKTEAERTGVKIAGSEQSVLLLTLEPNISGDPEAAKGADSHDVSHTHVEICAMFSGSEGISNIKALGTASNDGHSRSMKRKFPALDQRASEVIGMEDQRSFLEAQGPHTHAVDCILSKERGVKSRFRNSSIKQLFLDWKIS